MKQFIVILFVAMAFFMVACAKTEDVKPEEGLKVEGTKEVKKDVKAAVVAPAKKAK